jgi:hypothetical protein
VAGATDFGYNLALALGDSFFAEEAVEGRSSTPRVGFTRVRKSSQETEQATPHLVKSRQGASRLRIRGRPRPKRCRFPIQHHRKSA